LTDLLQYDTYWHRKRDWFGRFGFSPEQKITCALRMLAYGKTADELDEQIRMAESTVLKNLKLFCEHIIAVYGKQYLRKPTKEDLEFILALHSSRGWPGMLGSLDVMHWEWKNCPVAWHGQFTGKFFLLYNICLD
jgi:hypothetical protein